MSLSVSNNFFSIAGIILATWCLSFTQSLLDTIFTKVTIGKAASSVQTEYIQKHS